MMEANDVAGLVKSTATRGFCKSYSKQFVDQQWS